MTSRAKQAVALSSILASGAMVAMKLAVGLLTGSLGVLSEAAHSLLDLGTATLTWFAVRLSDAPADDRHPYGHGKFESVSALVGTGLLFLTAMLIVKEAGERLLSPVSRVETTWYSVAVVLVSIAIDVGRSRALAKVARETGSQALEADALHFSSDILSSAAVLIGLVGVALGWPRADAIAALAVAGFVAHAGWDLGKRTVAVLVDTAPEGLSGRVRAAVLAVPGVAQVDQIRARPAGTTIFVDLVVRVSRTLLLEQVEQVRRRVEEAIRAVLPEAQSLVVTEPLTLTDETIAETVRVLAAARGWAVHDLGVANVEGRPHVSFDLEVDERQTIAQAHVQASAMESALVAELGRELAVDIHLDPRRAPIFLGIPLGGARLDQVRAALEAALAHQPLAQGYHHLRVQEREDGLFASCHVLFPDECSLGTVHQVVESLQFAVLRGVEGMARVVIHAEPSSHPEGMAG